MCLFILEEDWFREVCYNVVGINSFMCFYGCIIIFVVVELEI